MKQYTEEEIADLSEKEIAEMGDNELQELKASMDVIHEEEAQRLTKEANKERNGFILKVAVGLLPVIVIIILYCKFAQFVWNIVI